MIFIRKIFYINQNKFDFRFPIGIFIWILFFIITPIIVAINFKVSIFYVTVNSNSMSPTIDLGDTLIVSRLNSRSIITKGDIIVFYSEELSKTLIKRVVALPGDTVYIDETFNLIVNGKNITKSSNFNFSGEYKYCIVRENSKFIVPNGSYFVIGDNLNNSFDSRFWNEKFIPREVIIGKAKILIDPINRFKVF